MNEKRRVVVTGLGAVTPLGNSAGETWKNLLAGESGIERVVGLNPDVETFGTLKDFDAAVSLGDKKLVRTTDPFTHYALVASIEAFEDSGLKLQGFRDDTAVYAGNCVGGLQSTLEGYDTLLKEGASKVNPRLIPMMMPNSASATIASILKLRGPSITITTACAASNDAGLAAYEAVAWGKTDIALVVGTEHAMVPVAIAGFANMHALIKNDYLVKNLGGAARKASRPYDALRNGFVMGSGAVAYIVESLESAIERAGKVYAEMLGGGQSDDAGHITNIDPEGVTLAIRRALESSGVQPCEVDYVAAHGTSTQPNDKQETAALKDVFGEHAHRLLISSNKSMLSHLVGGAGAANALSAIKSIQTGHVHPTINYENPDPECDLNYVPKRVVAGVRVALSNAFGFGGQNSVLVFKGYEE